MKIKLGWLYFWIFCCFSSVGVASQRPNILLIVSEDNGPELGCYGDPYAKTPILDKLAQEGARFEFAFTPFSVCSPSRACFLTGLHPVVNGHLGLATHKFELFKEFPNIFGLLKKAGYRTGLIGKLHVNPKDLFYENLDFKAMNLANFDRKSMSTYASKAAEFFSQTTDKPFFLSINYPDAHFPLIPRIGDYPLKGNLLEAKDVKPLPWVGCDTERLREATANYYNCINRLDCLVGDLLEELRHSGNMQNTMIFYFGDHGAQFSRGKTSVYDAGTRIPFLVKWPGKIKQGLVIEEMVSVEDILPTCLLAAGMKLPEKLSGRALQPLFKGEEVSWRDSLQFITTGAAPSIACLQFAHRTDRFKLIITPRGQGKNLSALAYLNDLNSFYVAGTKQKEIDTSPEWLRKVYKIYENPPLYELYDLSNDPYEFVDLSCDPNHVATLNGLLKDFYSWRFEIGDPFIDSSKVNFWIREQTRARSINYKGIKGFRWKYLERFLR